MLACALTLLAPSVAYPSHIGCDFKVVAGKSSAAKNVMTTSDNIMGKPPKAAPTLGATTSKTFTAGSNVTFDFDTTIFKKGFAHATAGTFTAPEFNAARNAKAAACIGTNTMVTKSGAGTATKITWTAPADVGALTSVTFSFAASGGYTDGVHRNSMVLKKAVPAKNGTAAGGSKAAPAKNGTAAGGSAATTSGGHPSMASGAFTAMLAAMVAVMQLQKLARQG